MFDASFWERFDLLKPLIPKPVRKPAALVVALLIALATLLTTIKRLREYWLALSGLGLSPLSWSVLLNVALFLTASLLGIALWRSINTESKIAPQIEMRPDPNPEKMSQTTFRSPERIYQGFKWYAVGKVGSMKDFRILELRMFCKECGGLPALDKKNLYTRIYCVEPSCRFEETFDRYQLDRVKNEVATLILNQWLKTPESFKPI